MRPRLFTLLAALWLTTLGSAAAHASLDASSPAAASVLGEAPPVVTLSFSESVEVGFSVFAVHRLESRVDLSEENASQRLTGLAAPQVKGWLDATEPAESLVPTTITPKSGRSSEVELTFADELTAGHYVVVWRVLSADTHPVEGFFTFSVTR